MNKRLNAYFYNTVIFFLILTGFGQMPIFKRYYIADIPGLGWLAQFYVTFLIHYIAATLLIVFIFYLLTSFHNHEYCLLYIYQEEHSSSDNNNPR